MKIYIFFVLTFVIILLAPLAQAGEASDSKDEFAIRLLYEYFESRYTPRDLLNKAQTEALYIAGEFRKSEVKGIKALDEFNQPHSRWNHLDGLSPISMILDMTTGNMVAHPNPALSKLLNKENIVSEYKDHAGRLIGVEAVVKLRKQPRGTWIFQYTTWTKSETCIATPMYTIDALVMIPGTSYWIMTVMPYPAASVEEINKTIDYLETMVEHWSVIK